MIQAGDFRNGITFELDSDIFQIIQFQHVKPGKGSAFVRAKIKSLINGSVIERTFNPNEKYKKAIIENKNMEYLYFDGEVYNFMDTETFEQIALEKDKVQNSLKFVKENDSVKFLIHNGNIFAIEPPNFVELKITETSPEIKGATVTNITKPATVETGAVVQVPMFIKEGEIIRIDARNGEYIERADKSNL